MKHGNQFHSIFRTRSIFFQNFRHLTGIRYFLDHPRNRKKKTTLKYTTDRPERSNGHLPGPNFDRILNKFYRHSVVYSSGYQIWKPSIRAVRTGYLPLYRSLPWPSTVTRYLPVIDHPCVKAALICIFNRAARTLTGINPPWLDTGQAIPSVTTLSRIDYFRVLTRCRINVKLDKW